MTVPDTHAVAAELELYAALLSRGSGIELAAWRQMLNRFTARERRVVVLHGIMGMSFTEIGERLGVTRSRADQLWRRALPKLRPLATQLGGTRR